LKSRASSSGTVAEPLLFHGMLCGKSGQREEVET